MSCRRYGFATPGRGGQVHPKPSLKQVSGQKGAQAVAASHADLGERYLYCEGDAELLFTENETNNERIFGTANQSPYVKDGINNYVVEGKKDAVNPEKTGTKCCRTVSVDCGRGKDRNRPSASHRCGACGHGRSLQGLC